MIKIKVRKELSENRLKPVKKKKRMTAKERDGLFGDKAGRQLAVGIMEEEEELEEFNTSHDSDGKFSDKKTATCVSDYFQHGGKRKRVGGSLSNSDEAGRGRKKSGQGRWICKNNRLKWEESKVGHIQPEMLVKRLETETLEVPHDTYDCAVKIREKEQLINKLKSMVVNADKRKLKNCPLSIYDAMKIINALELSTKGKLDEPKKID